MCSLLLPPLHEDLKLSYLEGTVTLNRVFHPNIRFNVLPIVCVRFYGSFSTLTQLKVYNGTNLPESL